MTDFKPTIYPWNEKVWHSLTSDSARSNHAYLFAGNPGLGKQATALAFAHHVLTADHAQSVALFNAGSHPDFHVLLPECEVTNDALGSHARRYLEQHGGKPRRTITIDQVRSLGKALDTHPHIATTRVVLIAYAETMNRNAANALLKNLEEPPANTVFILLSDEVARLAPTVRSRCSIITLRAPQTEVARSWLIGQGVVPQAEIDTHLALSDNHPLLAQQYFEEQYMETLKSVFNSVNSLWNQRNDAVTVARSWQQTGGLKTVNILQKLTTDLLRCCLTETPPQVFFPVQLSWLQTVSNKISQPRLLELIDELIYARRMLSTTVDELLVLETVSVKFQRLPA
ncbi:MAG: hypothetical protein KJP04_08555 [Arenicella sp.]|nr:hypothetical protein [Arenicella sp.]